MVCMEGVNSSQQNYCNVEDLVHKHLRKSQMFIGSNLILICLKMSRGMKRRFEKFKNHSRIFTAQLKVVSISHVKLLMAIGQSIMHLHLP